jgi:CRISPR system Cascade subunit CasB
MKSIRERAAAAARWWRSLQPYRSDGTRNPSADRAALARLRHADLFAAMQDPETFALFRDLRCHSPGELPAVALCAAVLASVREDRAQHPARTLGPPSMNAVEQAVMKRLRFRRLIEAPTEEERLIALRRAVVLGGGGLNVRELAAACIDWSEARRRRWIFEYYNAGFAAPPGAEPSAEESNP